MPVVVVATMKAKPESVDAVREACTNAIAAVHEEPGCQLYSLHESDGTFVFVEQWADADALKTHSTAPAIGTLFGSIGELLDGAERRALGVGHGWMRHGVSWRFGAWARRAPRRSMSYVSQSPTPPRPRIGRSAPDH